MKKRLLSVLLILVLFAGLLSIEAFAEEGIPKVSIRIYPDSSYGYDNNQDPLIGEDASYIYAVISSGEATLTDYYLMDGGSRASGAIQDHSYTFHANVQAVDGYIFDASTGASVNNESASLTIIDPSNAYIELTVKPRANPPTIYKSPGDETHPAGSTFSFVASAGHYDSFQWYIQTPYNMEYKAEEVYDKVGLYAQVVDQGSSVKLNLSGVTDGFNGWMVYCVFTGQGGTDWTNKAMINVTGASDPFVPAPTPAVATSQITIVETPAPTNEIWIVETPTPEIVETPAPTAEPTPEVTAKTKDSSSHKGLKIAGGIVGGLVVLGGGLVGTQYVIDKKKRAKRAKSAGHSSSNYKGRH